MTDPQSHPALVDAHGGPLAEAPKKPVEPSPRALPAEWWDYAHKNADYSAFLAANPDYKPPADAPPSSSGGKPSDAPHETDPTPTKKGR